MIGAAIVGGVGAILGAAGFLVAVHFPRAIDAERKGLERLRPLGAEALGDAGAGQAVALEGHISAAQPVLYNDLVAFVRLERRRTEGNKERWSSKERKTPSLLIELPDGQVRVINTSYSMRGGVTSHLDSSVDELMESTYTGLVAGGAVLIVGRVAAGGIEAEFVAPGTYRSYLSGLLDGRATSLWLGYGLGVVGILLAGIASFLALRRPGSKRSPGER